MTIAVERGLSHPLGATYQGRGVNFSLFSKHCQKLELLLFDEPQATRPSHIIRLDPQHHKSFYYWHVFVPGLRPGQLYAYRAYGPFDPDRGHRYDGSKVLVDPHARAVVMDNYVRESAKRPGDNCAQAIKSVVVDIRGYDWEGDKPLRHPYSHSVIYEMHVGGFTRHANSGLPPALRGTYAGLIQKIPYLQALGITAVELLPVQQFDAQDSPSTLPNYWGYSPIAFFAPHSAYSSDRSPLGPMNEFRNMVKALHRAGIEVILDVVFNHTAEGDHTGPTLSFKGLENRTYYLLQENQAYYANFSGCGNTVNGNHSVMRRLIADCLRYWVQVMHVDGFRFDLASILTRDEYGHPIANPPVVWDIESDPVLAGTKIIAEAWDAAGLYQVGSFAGERWAEWNGHYRDDVRRFIRGDKDTVGRLATRLAGSPDLYTRTGHEPHRSINFLTAHDGFTLNDLVSYNNKHNEANNEGNRDGHSTNHSWNSGAEGPSDDPEVEALRLRQIKNFLTVLMVSQGTPMLLMGDEVRRTQHGNNNAYCQDNETSWFDWDAVQREAGLLRFTQHLIHLNQARSLYQATTQSHSILGHDFKAWDFGLHLAWHGTQPNRPDWLPHSHSLAFSLREANGDERLYMIFNAYWEALSFTLPQLPSGYRWYRILDTALPAPDDYAASGAEVLVPNPYYAVTPRSCVILLADARP